MGKNERETAVDILTEVLNGTHNNAILKRTLDASGYSGIQKHLVTELVNGTIRNLIYIDYVLSKFVSKSPKRFVKNLLRVAVYQICFADKIPDYAACNEATDIVKRREPQNAGFVNAVLRKVSADKGNTKLPQDKKEYIAVKYSMPIWIIDLWLSRGDGFAFVEKICEEYAKRPNIYICVNTRKTDAEELTRILEGEGALVSKTDASPNTLKIENAAISEIQSFKDGLFHVMDVSASIAADMPYKFGDVPNAPKILDACAAPGGKSFRLAQLYPKGEITACDIYENKLERVREGAARLGLDNINVLNMDAAKFSGDFFEAFDIVVVDAPCSGLGLLRKKPDIKFNRKPDDVQTLAKTQRAMLKNCAKYVKRGGILLYCACTITYPENQGHDDFILNEIGGFQDTHRETLIQPHIYDSDGFYSKMFVRVHN